ncbi:MAG: hypothetical protein IJ598_12055 [Ruminococcus sp.]|nr:hypothetical protein [Ruminococcus sp.]
MMKLIRTLTSCLLSAALLLPAVTSAGAITVVKDGKEYLFRSATPTTGDCNVLMIRVGFADYPADGGENPVTDEQTLLSYFDGSEGSVNGYYETSSYGSLRLHCDKVYTYNAQHEREYYNGGTEVSEELLTETLDALKDDIDVSKYDSNDDGNLDFVSFEYAGPLGEWGTTWWSYVFSPENVSVKGKRVPICTFLRGDAETYKHEFGHILGMPDYYSHTDNHPNAIMTFDMMSNHHGDHNGFSKWSYGWLNEDDIAFIDKASGDVTVTLAPIETKLGDGKKIAVIAPAFSQDTRFLDEYFLVEYDSGQGNNKKIFEEYRLQPGFRVFHVNAKAEYTRDEASLLQDNDLLRSNLIHNVKNELDDYVFTNTEKQFYREGDALTPLGYPNTGFVGENVYNGNLTGISITDFTTGDHPSFKVSFSEEPVVQEEPKLTVTPESLNAAIRLSLTSDASLTKKRSGAVDYEAPYLMDNAGNKLPLDVTEVTANRFDIRYNRLSPAVQSDTEYTLVIPKGLFRYGYEQEVPELRQTIRTDSFLTQTVIERYAPSAVGKRISNDFAVTNNTYGRIILDSDTATCDFVEMNLDGEEIARHTFNAPDYGGVQGQRLFSCSVYTLNDGNFAFCVYTLDNTYFTKIDRSGKALSKTFAVSDELVKGYANSVNTIRFEPLKGGLYKRLIASDYSTEADFIIDFEHEPQLQITNVMMIHSLNQDYYIRRSFLDGSQHLCLCDKSDRELADITVDNIFIGVFMENNSIYVLSKQNTRLDNGERVTTVRQDVYDITGKLLRSEDITANAAHLGNYFLFDRIIPTDSGYFIVYNNAIDQALSVIACDREWKRLGMLNFDTTAQLLFTGECGLAVATQYDRETQNQLNIVSRFHIGDFEIVPKRVARLLGDADGDGVITVSDATLIQKASIGLETISPSVAALCDVNGDGKVSILDTTYVQKYVADIAVPYPIGEPIE